MKRLAALVLLLSLAALVAGCGRKTAPVPPQAVVAAPISDLRSQLDDQGATLTWTYPPLSEIGTRIDNIRTFLIAKARIPAADYCSGCPVIYDYQYVVDARAAEPGQELTFRDTDLKTGFYYLYTVRSNSGWRIVSQESNRIAFQRHPPLLPPSDLQVESGESMLSLSWSPVRHRTDGSPVSGLEYQVYRSLDNEKYRPLGLPTTELSLIDLAVTNGRTYFYQVRAVVREGEIMALGRASKTAIGMPLDMTPPPPPATLLAVTLQEGVQLHWQTSPGPDVAGYFVYRKGPEGRWQRIATTRAGAITYTDLVELPAGAYSYRVTAFDTSARRNESEPSPIVTHTRP